MEAKRAMDEQAKVDEVLAKRARLDKEMIPDYRDRMRDERRRHVQRCSPNAEQGSFLKGMVYGRMA